MNASISVWLDGVPDSAYLLDATTLPGGSTTKNTKKRARDCTNTSSPRKAPRRALASMTSNLQRPRRETRQSTRKPPVAALSSPSRTPVAVPVPHRGQEQQQQQQQQDAESGAEEQQRQEREELEEALGGEGQEEGDDDDVAYTPRATVTAGRSHTTVAASRSHPTVMTLPPPPFGLPAQPVPALPSAARSSASSSRTRSTTSTSTRSRTRSPTKQTSDLKFADLPVVYNTPSHVHFPDDVRGLDMELKRIAKGRAVLPEEMRATLEPIMDTENYAIDDFDLYRDPNRTPYDRQRELDDLRDICRATNLARSGDASEPSWNSTVHSLLFLVAFRRLPGILHHDVTIVQPCPEFVPLHYGSGMVMQSKLVDYTINLMPPPGDTGDFDHRVLQLLQHVPQEQETITQSMYGLTRLRPAAISVETKGTKGTDAEAKLQLGLWVAAHFKRMRALLNARPGEGRADVQIPSHPIIIANATSLSIMYAAEHSNPAAHLEHAIGAHVVPGPTSSSTRKTTIYIHSGPDIPLPKTLLDGYRCLKALRCLAQWADRDYRRWVESELLG